MNSDTGGGDFVIVEDARPLAESSLWGLQASYFLDRGPSAWAAAEVPYLVSTSRLVATVYATVLATFIRACGAGSFGEFDPGKPVYLVELGAGSGRLAFSIVDILRGLLSPTDPAFVYVPTDMATANIAAWRSHSKLVPFFEQGIMDSAVFDVVHDREILLQGTKVRLAADCVSNPMAFIATYLFDVIPQDLFASVDGDNVECTVSLASTEKELDVKAPELIKRLRFALTRRDLPENRYGDPEIDAILRDSVSQTVDYRGRDVRRVLFPAAGLRCVKNLLQVSSERLLLLVGERADLLPQVDLPLVASAPVGSPCVESDWDSPGEAQSEDLKVYSGSVTLGLAVHGNSFSLPVDLGAIGRLFRGRDGEFLFSQEVSTSLEIAAFISGEEVASAELRSVFADAIRHYTSNDLLFSLSQLDPATIEGLDLNTLFELIRLMKYDTLAVASLRRGMAARLATSSDDEKREVVQVLRRSYATYFMPCGNEGRLRGLNYPLVFATLFAAAQEFEEALDCAETSIRGFGDNPVIELTAASALVGLGRIESARERAQRALEIQPGFPAAVELLAKLPPGGPPTLGTHDVSSMPETTS